MASYLTDMDEIHRIIFEAPDSSDDSWQSSSEDSIPSSGSDSESETAALSTLPHSSRAHLTFSSTGLKKIEN